MYTYPLASVVVPLWLPSSSHISHINQLHYADPAISVDSNGRYNDSKR
jgi:hypothetical protein